MSTLFKLVVLGLALYAIAKVVMILVELSPLAHALGG